MKEIIGQVKTILEEMEADCEKFSEKRNNAAGTRLRTNALEAVKLLKQLRVDVQEAKNARKEAKKGK